MSSRSASAGWFQRDSAGDAGEGGEAELCDVGLSLQGGIDLLKLVVGAGEAGGVIAAIFGFAGVVLGSLTTSILTIYPERIVNQRERTAREQQYQRERKAVRDAFQRESVLALQSAVTELIGAAYAELDRLLDEFRETGEWNARRWETPTAVGWSTALLSLESSRARVFDEEMRSLADELRTVAGKSVWAKDLESAKETSRHLEPLLGRFNTAVTAILPNLY